MVQNNSSETAQVWADRLERFDQAEITVAQFCQNGKRLKSVLLLLAAEGPRPAEDPRYHQERPSTASRQHVCPSSTDGQKAGRLPARHACSVLTGHCHGRRSAGRHSHSIRDPVL
ncbi:hypothetical protein Enr10x_53770 [Gimesia panareensis]|uniref:Uncharacterized protein n=1 Tax=Gimesia panareensis TaxID=2527978 RepID=A0A517PZH8_9PLAN|nr:hypothetical protein Enr10x_00740 [Gimesia panareensis]QDT25109.1 hypothetical protein Enr10x_04030 [Gimesia panareensis]QDT25127.1 hypothetical protein Enr10x_04210 [Gimesia panareensis]QDT27371.1 hypothetical protein Enr10x_26880 [Gimesia panareensis]QDT27544.1 hypothetical protein Enr10x_28620 [Gimesia panareensis]